MELRPSSVDGAWLQAAFASSGPDGIQITVLAVWVRAGAHM